MSPRVKSSSEARDAGRDQSPQEDVEASADHAPSTSSEIHYRGLDAVAVFELAIAGDRISVVRTRDSNRPRERGDEPLPTPRFLDM